MSAPYGSWPSAISVDDAAADSGSFSWPAVVGDTTWWCGSDPSTASVTLWRGTPGGGRERVLPDAVAARNRALGYGGRPYAIEGDRLVITRYDDHRLHRGDPYGDPGQALRPLTPPDAEGSTTWYADPRIPPGTDHVWCVRETTRAATGAADADPAPRTRRDVVRVPLSGAGADDPAAVVSVAASHHFLTNARPSPDGRRLLWIGWDHPAMPWIGTELMLGTLDDAGRLTDVRVLLGGAEVSVSQAEWAGDDTVYAMADPDGWWNLHRITLSTDPAPTVECVSPLAQDCAGAIWRVGAGWFAVCGDDVVFAHGGAAQQLSAWNSTTAELRELAPGWAEFGSDLMADEASVVVTAGSPTASSTVLRVPLDGGAPVACASHDDNRWDGWLAVPRRRTAVDDSGQVVHYVWYPPTHPRLTGPDDERPPLLIHVHGGPTNRTSATPDLEISLFTSRGFAVASVDYGGSTGYGRAYRERLRHNWGIVDVADSVTVARALAEAGEVDGDRVGIRGGSAGGWTSLACLATTDTFCAGAVYYPISDPLTWRGGNTHDFESRYVDSLVGRLPDDRAHYERVSPRAHADAISSPLVMLQGADDDICKPDQATTIVDAVAARGLWHRLELFPGEGHGFRRASSVRTSLARELELYAHAMRITTDAAASDAPDPTDRGDR